MLKDNGNKRRFNDSGEHVEMIFHTKFHMGISMVCLQGIKVFLHKRNV